MPEVSGQPDDAQAGVARGQSADDVPRSIRRPVVDEHDLVRPERDERGGEASMELADGLGLVVHGRDD